MRITAIALLVCVVCMLVQIDAARSFACTLVAAAYASRWA